MTHWVCGILPRYVDLYQIGGVGLVLAFTHLPFQRMAHGAVPGEAHVCVLLFLPFLLSLGLPQAVVVVFVFTGGDDGICFVDMGEMRGRQVRLSVCERF